MVFGSDESDDEDEVQLSEDDSSLDEEDSSENDEEVETEEELKPDDTVYVYKIPLEQTNNIKEATYTPTSGGKGYLTYYGPDTLVVITDKHSPQFHRDEVNVTVEKYDREVIEASDDKVRDFA